MAKRLKNLLRHLTAAVRNASDKMYDRRYGVNTRSFVGTTPEHTVHGDPKIYESPAWIHIKLVLRHLRIKSGDVIVDYGCGSGRVLCASAVAGATRVIGVEMSPELAEACRQNLSRLRGGAAEHTVVEGDAALFRPESVTHAFFFNPFGPETLGVSLKNLESMADRQGAPLTAVYLHPVHREVFETRPGWETVKTLQWSAFRHPTIVYRYSSTEPTGVGEA